jgi:hypothetical protein
MLSMTAAGGGAMSTRLGKVIRWGYIVVANLFVLTAFFSLTALSYGIPTAYRPPLMMLFYGLLVVWCLYTLLWHWKELAGREVLARILAGLYAVFAVAVVLHAWRYESDKPIFVTVKPGFSLDLGGDVVTSSHLIAALETATKGNHKERIIVLPTRSVSRQYYLMLGGLLGSAGYVNYGLSPGVIRHSPRRNHTYWTSLQS